MSQARRLGPARLGGPRWRSRNPIGHVAFFTRQSLANLLVACGFRIVRQRGLNTFDAAGARAGQLGNDDMVLLARR